MVWKAGAPGPKTLMLEDFVNITKSSAFFARKVDPEYSAELILKTKVSQVKIHKRDLT